MIELLESEVKEVKKRFRSINQSAARYDWPALDWNTFYEWFITTDSPDSVCPWCNIPLTWKNLSIDHHIPLSRQGEHREVNLRIICSRCNRYKKSLLPDDWANLLRVLADIGLLGYFFREYQPRTWTREK